MPGSSRSLRFIMLVLVGVILCAFILLFFFVLHSTMVSMLLTSEEKYMEEQVNVTEGMFGSMRDSLYLMTYDTAYWEETAAFVDGKNPEYIEKNWPDILPLESYRYNLMLIKDAQGHDLYASSYDYLNRVWMETPPAVSDAVGGISARALQEYGRIRIGGTPAASAVQGIHFIEGAPYYLCTIAVAYPGGEAGHALGTLTFGYALTNAFFQDITNLKDTQFQLSIKGSAPLATGDVFVTGDDMISISLALKDIDGDDLLLYITKERTIYIDGQGIIGTTMLILLVTAGVLIVVIYWAISRHVIKPIEKLSTEIQTMALTGKIDTGEYARIREFEALGSSINIMIDVLNQTNISINVFKSILNGMDAFLYVTDPRTDEILFINDKMVEHFGLNRDVVGERCWEVFHNDYKERCPYCPVNRLMEAEPGKTHVWESYNDVTGHFYKNMDCMIEWSDKSLVHLQHSMDVTNVKTAEEALTRRLEQQELMSAISQSFISTADTDVLIGNALRMTGLFIHVGRIMILEWEENTGGLELRYEWANKQLGIEKSEQTVFTFPSDSPLYDAFAVRRSSYIAYDDILREPVNAQFEELGVRALMAIPIYCSGALYGLLLFNEYADVRSWSPSDIQLGRLIGSVISGVFTRRRMEVNLHRMSSIVNSSPQYIAYSNVDGAYEYLNQGALEITGYSSIELMEGGLGLILSQENADRIRHDITPAVQETGWYSFEMPILRKDGEERILLFSSFMTSEREPGIGSIATDVTEKRRLEKELVAAKELAEQSSRAKSDFLSRMSHEMRTPMNAIIGMTSVAKLSDDAEKKEYCLDKIDDASKHLLGVINDILDMSKIEANKFDISLTEFPFEHMLMRVTNVVNFRVDEKKQNFIIQVDKEVPYSIVSDDQRLAQVITNLLSNSVKFTPEEGTISLHVSLQSEEDGLCTLLFEVRDSGIGISAEQQQRLFRSFEQADGGISRRFGGTGLGLAISKRIVELLDGEIWVESDPGEGSLFAFTIQAARGSIQKPQNISTEISWKTLRVLAVDDSPEVLVYFEGIAEMLELNLDTAPDGYAACDALKTAEKPYNIIFVDWRMPGMNGIDLTRKIKQEYGENTVVIMISATEWNELEQEARSAGVDHFIPKPLFPSQIVNCINQCLGIQQVRKEEESSENYTDLFLGKRVLLAEDMEINREIVLTLLAETGVEIDCAENGVEAVKTFSDRPELYDMVFMDIHMPEMDGFEATRRIRALDCAEARRVPIVAMTANVFREDIERCLAAGMNDHIGKPIDLDEIIEKMQKYLFVGA